MQQLSRNMFDDVKQLQSNHLNTEKFFSLQNNRLFFALCLSGAKTKSKRSKSAQKEKRTKLVKSVKTDKLKNDSYCQDKNKINTTIGDWTAEISAANPSQCKLCSHIVSLKMFFEPLSDCAIQWFTLRRESNKTSLISLFSLKYYEILCNQRDT